MNAKGILSYRLSILSAAGRRLLLLLALIAATAAQVKNVPLATLAEATRATAHRFFPKLG